MEEYDIGVVRNGLKVVQRVGYVVGILVVAWVEKGLWKIYGG